jgi:hypothetical protein
MAEIAHLGVEILKKIKLNFQGRRTYFLSEGDESVISPLVA